MKYTFDDLAIGLAGADNRTLKTREIDRPKGLSASEWYAHACAVCSRLNTNPVIRQAQRDVWVEGSRLNCMLLDKPDMPEQTEGMTNAAYLNHCRTLLDAAMVRMIERAR